MRYFNSHMQAATQKFWSEAFQFNLAELNFFEWLYFDPNNSSWNMNLPSTHLKLSLVLLLIIMKTKLNLANILSWNHKDYKQFKVVEGALF